MQKHTKAQMLRKCRFTYVFRGFCTAVAILV